MSNRVLHWQTIVREYLRSHGKPLIVIVGPTASGKTEFALQLGESLGRAEIVNADSRQLYRGLDVGTAKTPLEERRGVPHHLLDVLDPREEVTVGWYQSRAEAVIAGILGRGDVPILTGGSMLYVSSIVDGLSLAPPPDRAMRMRLTAEYYADAGESLYRKLCVLDPESAYRIDQRNKPALVRAVELCEILRGPRSQAVPRHELRAGDCRATYDLLMFGMSVPREELHRRINIRTRHMIATGWIAEVRSLLERGYTADDPGMKSHGYREIIAHLQKGETATVQDLSERIAAKTRQYAKRQMTWWRNDPRIQWGEALRPAAREI